MDLWKEYVVLKTADSKNTNELFRDQHFTVYHLNKHLEIHSFQ